MYIYKVWPVNEEDEEIRSPSKREEGSVEKSQGDATEPLSDGGGMGCRRRTYKGAHAPRSEASPPSPPDMIRGELRPAGP